MKKDIIPVLRLVIIAFLSALFSGCAGITAINIPGVGYFDSDPPPVNAEDKYLMYSALVAATDQRRVGAFTEWANPQTGHYGTYEVTRVNFRIFSDPYGSPYGLRVPAAEVSETIHAGGREFVTHGIGVYVGEDGQWYRYK